MSRAPELGKKSFNCPHCDAFSQQDWRVVLGEVAQSRDFERMNAIQSWSSSSLRQIDESLKNLLKNSEFDVDVSELGTLVGYSSYYVSRCNSCNEISFWKGAKLIYPAGPVVRRPDEDMPDNVRSDYLEAAAIVERSPRGAAALLRLSIQNLVVHLGESGKNLNEDIGSLVRKGLDYRIRDALDVVRVIGNNSVHPGEMDIRDDRKTAYALFDLVNFICNSLISQQMQLKKLRDLLPEGALKAIERRDQSE